jgi:hypothetical protein
MTPQFFRDLNANWWEENASLDKHFPLDSFASEIVAAHDLRAALFGPACRNKVAGLKANGTITETTKARMRRGATIFRGRFDMHLKNLESGNPTTKARMVSQSAHDPEKRFLITHAPTAHRCSARLLCTVAASTKTPVWTRDITQAFLQSN